jgi:chromosome partitioning protein
MKVITFTNEKGGVGKTTMSVLLACRLAAEGFRILLVDGDSQGHASVALNQKRYDGLWALIAEGANPVDVCIHIPTYFYGGQEGEPNLWLLPSSTKTRDIGDFIKNTKNCNELVLKQRLQLVADRFHYVIIDTSPSISSLHTAYYLASDYIIAPTECEKLPIQGLLRSVTHLQKSRQVFSEAGYDVAELIGIVPTKFYGREVVQHQNLGFLRGKLGDDLVMTPIRRLSDWSKASQVGEPIYVFAPNTSAARDGIRFVEEVKKRLNIEQKIEV